jgi:hypothetical protein
MLVAAEGAGLFQHTVDKRGLAMVNVRNDRDVSDFFIHQCFPIHSSNEKFRFTAIVNSGFSWLKPKTAPSHLLPGIRKNFFNCDRIQNHKKRVYVQAFFIIFHGGLRALGLNSSRAG